jgi:uncharacterized membrane protein YbhN (UPF0104 family)
MLAAFGAYALFLASSGVVFAGVLSIAGAELTPGGWGLAAASYVVAWLAGLLTPGAPAGIGVRELVLTLLLAGIAAPALVVLAVLLGRVVTVVGDLLFFAGRCLIR